jgi:hypothetical protein
MKLKLSANTELRVEGAVSERSGRGQILPVDGSAYFVEIDRKGETLDLLAYTNRQGGSFGMGQQGAATQGRMTTGLSTRWKITDPLSLSLEGSEEKDLARLLTRDMASARLEYGGEKGSVFGGVQAVKDETNIGQSFESHQGILGASRSFFDDTLELLGRVDFALGGMNESLDYPSRYLLESRFKLTEATRLIVAHEISDGASFDTQMTRMGLQTSPWKGARLQGTLNQSISEYGPRSFAVYGLSQSWLLGKHWGVDLTLDQSRTFNEATLQAPVINLANPIASGGSLGGGVLHDDYLAISAGATYRHDIWSWNGRIENRHAGIEDRIGLVTGFLREATAGIAFASGLRFFETDRISGAEGHLGNMHLSLAYRPLGHHWAVLDRFEFQHETLKGGGNISGSGLFGVASLTGTAVAESRALLNHLNINWVSRAWTVSDRQGNLFHLNQRNQWSFYYGSQYRFDQYSGKDYKDYIDLIGLDLRYDITTRIDLGLHVNQLHSFGNHNYLYAYGPSIGFSPVENGWLTLGYNVEGFRDRYFEQARYTAQGVYFTVRIKFDQEGLR